jgi:nucleotide-binding universal stress UspA family protein
MAGAIVLGYDGSAGSQAALTEAIELAKRFGDRLVIGYGVEPPGSMGEEFKEHRRALEEMGSRATEEALERARSAGVETEVALVSEKPAAALTALALEHEARYIVVGTYGESPLRGAMLGSTPHKLLHLSEVPVVVVPAAG